MKRENFYRRDPGAALSGMVGMTLEDRGVYNTVLDLLYLTWRPLEDSPAYIAAHCGCAVQKVNPIIRRLLASGKLVRFEEDGRFYISNPAFERERLAVKGQGATRSGRAGVGEKSGEVEEKSEGVQKNPPGCDDEHKQDQELTPLDKSREDKTTDTSVSVTRASEAEFEGWLKAYPHQVGTAAALAVWPIARDKATLAELTSAAKRYAKSKPKDRQWCNPAKWLAEERWRDHPADAGAADPADPIRVTFDGPAELRDEVAAAKGEAFAGSYLDCAAWRETPPTILTRTAFAADKLRKECAPILRKRGVAVEQGAQA